jgi:uncharacterized protein YyaL (SSP411 family)
MVSEEGFFFSAQDADSEGTEGLYFTFSKDEFVESFQDAPEEQKSKIDHFLTVFNITEKGNFDHGLNVISLNFEKKAEFYTQEGWQEIRDIRRRLLEQRKLRMPPATDRKGIAGWNYLLLSALCDVVQYCPVDIIQQQAFALIQQTVEGCLTQFLTVDKVSGRHLMKHSNTIENQALYLEDYVQFTDAQLRLFEVTGNEIFNFAIKKILAESKSQADYFLLDGFYREMHSDNDLQTGVVECALEIRAKNIVDEMEDILIHNHRTLLNYHKNKLFGEDLIKEFYDITHNTI